MDLTITKTSTISPLNLMVWCEFLVPDVHNDPNAAPAMGKSISEKSEELHKFVEEMWAPQLFRSVKKISYDFDTSKLPNRLVYKQPLVIKELATKGAYNRLTGIICVDFNTVITSSGSFVFGHEAGHKLLHVKSHYSVNSIIEEASRITGITNRYLLKEILCDEVGVLVSGNSYGVRFQFPYYKEEELKRLMLKLAWE